MEKFIPESTWKPERIAGRLIDDVASIEGKYPDQTYVAETRINQHNAVEVVVMIKTSTNFIGCGQNDYERVAAELVDMPAYADCTIAIKEAVVDYPERDSDALEARTYKLVITQANRR